MRDLSDLAGRDVYPADDASLIDAGDSGWATAVDFNCTERDGTPDQGAYEWVGSGNPGWIPEPDFKPACPTPGTPTDTDTPTTPNGTGTPTDPEGGAGDELDDGKGCGCRTGAVASPMWLLALLMVRRRRSSDAV